MRSKSRTKAAEFWSVTQYNSYTHPSLSGRRGGTPYLKVRPWIFSNWKLRGLIIISPNLIASGKEKSNSHAYLFLLLVLLLCSPFYLSPSELWGRWFCRCGGSAIVTTFIRRNKMFILMVSSSHKNPVRGGSFLCLLACFHLSSLVCSSMKTPNFVYAMPFLNVTYSFFVLFVAPKTSFVQL